MNDREHWYSQTFVLFEMLKCLRYREFAIIPPNKDKNNPDDKRIPTRYNSVYRLDFLKKLFSRYNVYTQNYNLYFSLASYDWMPYFSLDWQERKEDKKEWAQTSASHMEGFDFGIDFDMKGQNRKQVWKETKKVLDIFNSYKLPFILLNTAHGFQFRITQEFWKNKPKDLYYNESGKNYFWKMMVSLKESEKLKCLDMNCIPDSARIFALPYSLKTLEDETNVAVLPLSDQQFKDFAIEQAISTNALHSIKIMNRGLLQREGTAKNVEQFLLDYGG